MHMNLMPRMGNSTFRQYGTCLGDISPAEIAKRAGNLQRLVPTDFPGFGKLEKSYDYHISPGKYETRALAWQPYTLADVQAHSQNKDALAVIIHNTNLWKNFVSAYFSRAVTEAASGLWATGDRRKTIRGARTRLLDVADTILTQAKLYSDAIGLQKNIEATPDVVIQPVIMPDTGKVTQVVMPKAALAPIFMRQDAASSSQVPAGGMPVWLLPIGAGVAAYFMLKG